jgi:hypothetical protein
MLVVHLGQIFSSPPPFVLQSLEVLMVTLQVICLKALLEQLPVLLLKLEKPKMEMMRTVQVPYTEACIVDDDAVGIDEVPRSFSIGTAAVQVVVADIVELDIVVGEAVFEFGFVVIGVPAHAAVVLDNDDDVVVILGLVWYKAHQVVQF